MVILTLRTTSGFLYKWSKHILAMQLGLWSQKNGKNKSGTTQLAHIPWDGLTQKLSQILTDALSQCLQRQLTYDSDMQCARACSDFITGRHSAIGEITRHVR